MVKDATEPGVCRKAAARCRKLALSSSTPRDGLPGRSFRMAGEAAEDHPYAA